VDIWYVTSRRKSAQPLPMVDLATLKVTPNWSSVVVRVLSLVAGDPRVDRIFVHPVIKQTLCESATGDRTWLHKVRPWWGHHDHFHVRLACPAESPDCKAQTAIAPGDGCGELAWWLAPRAEQERSEQHRDYQARVGATPALPERCQEVLAAKPR
jgi:penicillin-insensitive murein endopeptidase